MHRRIRLAQYSLLHHSTNRRRVSRPIAPPSASKSLLLEVTEGAGDDIRDGIGDGARLTGRELATLSDNRPLALRFFAACDKLSRFPLPNLLHTWPSLLRCLFSWKIRHISAWWFFLCSESTALSSREVQDGAKSGEWKKAAKRSSAPDRAGVATLK